MKDTWKLAGLLIIHFQSVILVASKTALVPKNIGESLTLLREKRQYTNYQQQNYPPQNSYPSQPINSQYQNSYNNPNMVQYPANQGQYINSNYNPNAPPSYPQQYSGIYDANQPSFNSFDPSNCNCPTTTTPSLLAKIFSPATTPPSAWNRQNSIYCNCNGIGNLDTPIVITEPTLPPTTTAPGFPFNLFAPPTTTTTTPAPFPMNVINQFFPPPTTVPPLPFPMNLIFPTTTPKSFFG
jgi:hypothetical protein